MIEETKKSGSFHSFFLLDSAKFQPYNTNTSQLLNLNDIFRNYNCVNLHNDYLQYLNDTLIWIPTYNYWKKEESNGLNFHGNTIIKKSGAAIARKILTNWMNLFQCGTETFDLTGDFSYVANDPAHGFYEKIPTKRDELTKKLETIIFYCNQVIETEDKKFIWHFGI